MHSQPYGIGVVSLAFVANNIFFRRANSFPSKSPPPKANARPLPTNDREPTVLSLPGVLPPDRTSDMLRAVESSIRDGGLASTSSYQEDVFFSRERRYEEDGVLLRIVRPLLDENLMPAEYAEPVDDGDDPDAALQAFVYAVTKHQDLLSEEDIILGANIIQRRRAFERWKGEDGLAIMRSSLDDHVGETDEIDWDSISLGRRYELPPTISNELEELVPRLLRGSWTTVDATLVKYDEGDSQVPHVDPCDATLLICLKSCDEGGDTCFPSLEPPLRLENREGSGILFFSSNKIAGDASRDALSLHHGGKVMRGEKVVVQLMLDWNGDGKTTDVFDVPRTWLDIVID